MHTSALALLTGALAAVAQANILYVDNLCPFPVYLQSTAQNPAVRGPLVTLKANTVNAYHETLRPYPANQNALTISRTPNLANPLQAAYTVSNNGLTYYDLSTIYGDPFMTQGYELLSGGGGYSIICGPSNSNNCPYTYNPSNPNGNNALFTQPANANFALRLCKSGGSTSDVVPEPVVRPADVLMAN